MVRDLPPVVSTVFSKHQLGSVRVLRGSLAHHGGPVELATVVLDDPAGNRFELGLYFHLGLAVAAACFAWEYHSTRTRDPQACFKAFLHNHWAGLAILVGIVADYALR